MTTTPEWVGGKWTLGDALRYGTREEAARWAPKDEVIRERMELIEELENLGLEVAPNDEAEDEELTTQAREMFDGLTRFCFEKAIGIVESAERRERNFKSFVCHHAADTLREAAMKIGNLRDELLGPTRA